MAYARVGDFTAGYFFYRPTRYAALLSHFRPSALRDGELIENVGVNASFHNAESTPVFGCMQPGCGQRPAVRYAAMPAKRKLVSHVARHNRELMVDNLARLIRRAYPNMAPNTAYLRIGRDTGNSLSTMQRIMSGHTGPSIDTLADIAHNLGSTVAELLQPAKDPQLKLLRHPSRKAT